MELLPATIAPAYTGFRLITLFCLLAYSCEEPSMACPAAPIGVTFLRETMISGLLAYACFGRSELLAPPTDC